MRKTIYIVLAVLIASGITVLQVIIAKSASAGKSYELYAAASDIEAGTVLDFGHLQKFIMNTDKDTILPEKTDSGDLIGLTLTNDISKGQVVTKGCVYESDNGDGNHGYVALKVDGGNFNAGNLCKGDTVDIFFLPEYEKMDDYQVVWLNEVLQGSSRFIKGKHPGILIEDLVIDHIEKTAGDQAEYISIRVPRKVDEAIAFLEQISVYEFIGR